MKISVKKKDIIDMLANVQGIAGKKTSLAITENILIKSLDDKISLCATDIETGVEGIYPAQIKNEGCVAINARYLYDIVKKSKKPTVWLNEIKKQWIEITDTAKETNFKFNIVGGNVEDFPELPEITDFDYLEVSSLDFKNSILWAILIISNDRKEKRNHITGANLQYLEEGDKKILRMISTDGKRLTKTDVACQNNKDTFAAGKDTLIPKKALNEGVKFLDDQGTIKIGVKDNYFIVKKENETIYINLLSGDFPDLTTLFNEDEKRHKIRINRKEIRDMVERMSILTSDDYKGVIFKFEEKKLYINAANPDKGESYEFMEIDFKGEKIEAMFNPFYFIEAFNLIKDEDIYLKIKEEEAPCVVCGVNSEDNINIIMPMRI
jgi:DNA polymerase III subunit beta